MTFRFRYSVLKKVKYLIAFLLKIFKILQRMIVFSLYVHNTLLLDLLRHDASKFMTATLCTLKLATECGDTVIQIGIFDYYYNLRNPRAQFCPITYL